MAKLHAPEQARLPQLSPLSKDVVAWTRATNAQHEYTVRQLGKAINQWPFDFDAAGNLVITGHVQVDTFRVGLEAASEKNVYIDTDSIDWRNNEALLGSLTISTSSVAQLLLGASSEVAIDATVNGNVRLYRNNERRLETDANGAAIISGGSAPRLSLRASDDTDLALLQVSGDVLFVDALHDNGADQNVQIRTRNSAGTAHTCLIATPNATTLRYSNTNMFRTANAVTASTSYTGAEVLHNDGTFYPVGIGVLPAKTTASNTTLGTAHLGCRLHMGTTPHALTTPGSSDTSWPVGGWVQVSVGSAANGSTIVAGSGITLAWFTGAAVTTGSPRTLTTGAILWVYRRSSTTFDVYGWGIS